jgi:hypothetical protein
LRYILRAQVYNDELTRRETEKLTQRLNRLTWLIAVLTVLSVGLAAWTVLFGG